MADRLGVSGILRFHQGIESANGHFGLNFQGDGNFVLRDKRYGGIGEAIWSSKTWHEPSGKIVIMQGDGNLVIYDDLQNTTPPHAVWSSRTSGNPGAYLELKNSGNLEIIKSGRVIWETETTDPRLWTPKSSNFPLTFSDTHVHNGRLTAEVSEHGIGWIDVKGTHAGAGGSSKFGGRIALADSWGNITWMSDWVTVTVGADVWDQVNTNHTRRDLEIPQDRIKLSVKGKTFLWRDPQPWINGRFDQEIIKLVERGDKVYKTIKDSEMWKDYQKSQVGENAPGDPPPTYE